MEHNLLTYFGKIIVRVVWDFLYFPIWWYSTGLIKTLRGVWFFYRRQEASLGFYVWLKNMFVPMYGQYDIAGRLISFLIRLVQVIYRGLLMLINIVLGLLLISFYVTLPFLILLGILKQLF